MNRWGRTGKGFGALTPAPSEHRKVPTPLYSFYDEQRQLDLDFAEYFKGKRVAIVGKGIQEDTTDGDFIDSFDVVVRIHWPIPYHRDILPGHTSEEKPGHKWDPPPFVPERWQPVVGKKTDIFYTTIQNAGSEWCKSIADAFRDEGGKFICEWHPNIVRDSYFKYRDFVYKKPNKPLEDFMDRLIGFHPVRQLSRNVFDHMCYAVGCEPFGGLVAIADICRHNIDSIYLTGMQCFVSDEYPDGITPGRPDNDVVPYQNFKWLRQFVRDHRGRVAVDDYMEYVFKKH